MSQCGYLHIGSFAVMGNGKMEMRKKAKMALAYIVKGAKTLYGALFKWIILSVVIGIGIGSLASIFAKGIVYATEFRELHRWLIFGLPLAGLVIVWIYQRTGQGDNTGTDQVLSTIRETEGVMPGRIAPLILVSTVLTHLFGGSSGREGAALQFGASLGNWLARVLRLNNSDRHIMMLAGMSAAFSALFGTPMAAAIFPMEVVSVGVMYYGALVPCMFSSFIAEQMSVIWGVRTFVVPYPVTEMPNFYGVSAIKIVLLAMAFSLVGAGFCAAMHRTSKLYKKYFPNPYLRVGVGAVAVILLWLLVRTDDYIGLGGDVIARSFDAPEKIWVFAFKIIFTCLTLCAGFKGGEIVPSLFIGATLGSALSGLVGLPVELCAACGMAGVFCSVTNSPITAMLIAFELFKFDGMPYYCVVVACCYLLSGYFSLYHEQKIMYSKTENKYRAGK